MIVTLKVTMNRLNHTNLQDRQIQEGKAPLAGVGQAAEAKAVGMPILVAYKCNC